MNQPSLHKVTYRDFERRRVPLRVAQRERRADLPKRLAVPEADDGDRDAGDQAVAGKTEGEV